jgi:hypothetical protein
MRLRVVLLSLRNNNNNINLEAASASTVNESANECSTQDHLPQTRTNIIIIHFLFYYYYFFFHFDVIVNNNNKKKIPLVKAGAGDVRLRSVKNISS